MVAHIPKADLHMHAETRARLDRLVSRRDNRAAHDWAEELERLEGVPPGMPRLTHTLGSVSESQRLDARRLDALNDDDVFVEWLSAAMGEVAADGAVLLEVRFGAKGGSAHRKRSMTLFAQPRMASPG